MGRNEDGCEERNDRGDHFALVLKTVSKHPEMIRTEVQNTTVLCRSLRIDDYLVGVRGLSTGR